MADNFDEDDEYGKTVMMPSPFAQQKTEVAEPTTKETEPAPPEPDPAPPNEEPRRSAGYQRTTPGAQLSELQKTANPPAQEPSPAKRPRPMPAARGGKRRRSPALLIALSVLLIGAAAAAAIFIVGVSRSGPAPSAAPTAPKVTETITAPHATSVAPQPASAPTTAAPPTPPPAPATPPSTDLPPPAAIHVPAETKITADKPAAKPKPVPATIRPVIEIGVPPKAGGAAPPPASHGKKSFLAVTSSLAGVKIMVDGKSVGTTPTGPIEVQPGARFVTLIAPSGAKKGYAVEVESGDTYNLSESF